MQQRGPFTIWLALAAIVLMAGTPAMCGVSGKISGEVIDKETGEPIVGASVVIVGADIGTQTDGDGEFFIINLPVGKHDICVSSVGYESITKKEVRVLVDLTTPVDFEVEATTTELGQSIVVYADEPIIQQDLTSSRVIYTADRLENLPNITSVQSVLTNYPGVVLGRDNNLHVRGGRSGQVAYYYDGFSVQDPFLSSAGIRIMPSALEELSLTSSGFSAEYGEALSGIVNAVTREGGSEYHGGVKLYEGATHRYDVNTGTWGSLDRSENRSMTFDMSGPVPGLDGKNVTFFSAGEYLIDGTSLPHNSRESYTYTAKVAMQPMNRMKLKTNFTYYQREGDGYSHRDVNGISYDFNLDGLSAFKQDAYLFGVTGAYAFNEALILNATANRFKTQAKSAPKHLMDLHWSQWPGYSEDENGNYDGTIQDDNYLGYYDANDPLQSSGFTVGDDFDPTYMERQTIYNGMKLDVTAQMNKTHQMRTGVDAKRYETDWDSKQFYNANPYGETYTNKPLLFSAYVQDKMEYKDFIVNLGLRVDYRDADISYNITPQDSASIANRDTAAVYVAAETKTRVSPRLGVSFPISEKSKMHFNYGFYYQFPRQDYMNTNLQGDITSGLPLLGNPSLNPEQTVAYELGLDHLIGDLFHLNITAYYKDIEDLVTTRSAYELAGNAVTVFDNGDYGSVKGIDINLEKLASTSYFSGSVSYGYMIATGNGSSAYDPYYTYITSSTDTLAPVTEYPLDYDQRHTLTAVLDYRVPRDFKGQIMGVPIPSGWGLNVVGRYGSGLPYTPTDALGNRLGERNNARLPATYTVDMRFNKDFWLATSDFELRFFMEVDNLFNRLNVIDVYSRTGQPDDDGSRQIATGDLNQEEIDRLDRLYDHDPLNYTPPRTVRLGLGLKF